MKQSIRKLNENIDFSMHDEEWLKTQYDRIVEHDLPYAFIYLNIKKFEYLNLKYGWKQGNEILTYVYRAIQEDLSEGEYASHIYADHFNALYHSHSLPDLKSFVRERIGRLIDCVFDIPDERIYNSIYCSIGVYEITGDKCDFYEAQERANLARLEEPNIKNRTFSVELYTEKLLNNYKENYELQISTAMALQNKEYTVFIQPKVDIFTHEIVGGEALLRRFDKTGKEIPLHRFLPILNEYGYIRKVDWFVFETVCEALRQRYHSQAAIVPISFNISKAFFYDVFMCENYVQTFNKYDLPKEYVEFELMESISLNDTAQMIKVISQFKSEGFCCSLDDFGNGYSSFCVLLNADIDYIKLDRQFFIDDLNKNSRLIIKTMIDLAKSLNLKVIAEGVETQEYVDYLTEVGCDMIQGYYFYRPMPMQEFFQLLEEKKKV